MTICTFIEQDIHSDNLFTYVYPELADDTRRYVLTKLEWTLTESFVWGRDSTGFVYLLTGAPIEHPVCFPHMSS